MISANAAFVALVERGEVPNGRVDMLGYDDCVGLSGLTREEIAAIARHKHLPEIVASEMGACLCGSPEGKRLVGRTVEGSELAAAGLRSRLSRAARLVTRAAHSDQGDSP